MKNKEEYNDVSEYTRDKIRFFIRTGIVVLSFLVICALGLKFIPTAISVSNSASTKKLPIYCVNEDEKKWH